MKQLGVVNQRYITGIIGEIYVMFHVAQQKGYKPIFWRYIHKHSEIDLIYQPFVGKLVFVEVRSVIVSCETGDLGIQMDRLLPWKKKSAIIRACTGYVIRETDEYRPYFDIICAVVSLNKGLSLESVTFHTIYKNI